jgi:hypothetical protein
MVVDEEQLLEDLSTEVEKSKEQLRQVGEEWEW